MSWFANLVGSVSGLPWLKVGLFLSLLAVLGGGLYAIRLSGEQSEKIKNLQVAQEAAAAKNLEIIAALKAQHAKDAAIIKKEKDHAVQIARSSQALLDRIKSAGPGDDGPTRPVLLNTLNGMRGDSDAKRRVAETDTAR